MQGKCSSVYLTITPCRRIGAVEVQLHAFTCSIVYEGDQSASRFGGFTPGKGTSVRFRLKAIGVADRLWSRWGRGKSLAARKVEPRFTGCSFVRRVTVPSCACCVAEWWSNVGRGLNLDRYWLGVFQERRMETTNIHHQYSWGEFRYTPYPKKHSCSGVYILFSRRVLFIVSESVQVLAASYVGLLFRRFGFNFSRHLHGEQQFQQGTQQNLGWVEVGYRLRRPKVDVSVLKNRQEF